MIEFLSVRDCSPAWRTIKTIMCYRRVLAYLLMGFSALATAQTKPTPTLTIITHGYQIIESPSLIAWVDQMAAAIS